MQRANNTRANNHKLFVLEEQSLLKWVIYMDTRGAAPRPPHVGEMANILLAAHGTTPIQTVDQNGYIILYNGSQSLQRVSHVDMTIRALNAKIQRQFDSGLRPSNRP